MSGFTEYQASGASEASGRFDAVMTWAAARSMLPLVRHIVEDVMRRVERLRRIRPEKDRLDRDRHSLDWPRRSRRYQLGEEIVAEEAGLQAALAELESLGVMLLDAEEGLAGFPTLVNNRRAFFSWRPGEADVDFWHYAGSYARRPVPPSWKEPAEAPKKGKRKARPKR